ncbi:unnamed protein product [Toxocara canis]|uniref:Mitochondrial 2-oxoglutarate/malate carrier protein n=1 Tax=Toxocara canis TaxID=6265 RepID=A0A183UGC3_TOXCA|nr:unnamed protein product [Toxocara canis]
MFCCRGDKAPTFALKATLGLTAGAAGSFVGTPAEVALIRMCADGRLPADQQRNYKNVFDALIRIVREEGVTTLWRGCGPTVLRAMVVNAAQLATYSQAKEAILKTNYVKDDGKPEYKGAFDVWSKIVRNEGVFALWKGFTPYYFRIGPHTVLTFIFLEQMNALYFRKVLGIEHGRGAL